jgi:hypothetical protein
MNIVETGQFRARWEHGPAEIVIEETEMIDVTSLVSVGREYLPGLKRYRTLLGRALNQAEGGWKDVVSGRAIRRVA